jgi:hypothetical protein
LEVASRFGKVPQLRGTAGHRDTAAVGKQFEDLGDRAAVGAAQDRVGIGDGIEVTHHYRGSGEPDRGIHDRKPTVGFGGNRGSEAERV